MSFRLINHELLKRILYGYTESAMQGHSYYSRQEPIRLENIEGHIYNLGIKEKDLITSCSINNKACNWSKVLSPDGLCYAFNLIHPEEMFVQNM